MSPNSTFQQAHLRTSALRALNRTFVSNRVLALVFALIRRGHALVPQDSTVPSVKAVPMDSSGQTVSLVLQIVRIVIRV